MSKGKKRHTAHGSGKVMQGAEPIPKRKGLKPLSRNLIVSSVVLLAIAEVLLRADLVGETLNGVMYIVALILAVAALVVEYSGIGRNKFE